eukprot:CAMPEP_0178937268 /NCGR_PEP_ID=MMETSP0786-20121207/25653_1 /TAXON_ID=186022 /ORGANISM="Thalassionema frauenfeldii, Strain CCMP 1798" /LENGTH=501 /DNA_ID=CAMNT_0020615801 /DNA_START=3494 /DNA_END=4999 /DNA_ORIENTATION=-
MIPDDCSMSPHVQLPEQSDSSSDESSPPICNQACSESQISFDDQSRDCIKTDQDNYARAGAKLKNVISMALSLFWEHIGVDANENINHECNDKPATQQRIESSDNVLQLARKKTAECITLEKKVKEAEAYATAMTAANTSLRHSATASNDRMERTLEALRIAGANAANARADADAAEQYASSLATQLESILSVLEQTKRTTQALQDEHTQVASATKAVETKLLQRETEYLRLEKESKIFLESRQQLSSRIEDLVKEKDQLALRVDSEAKNAKRLSRELEERDVLVKAQKAQSSMVEKELQDVRAILIQASETTAENELTTAALNEDLQALRDENQRLHKQIQDMQEKFRDEQNHLETSVEKAEKSAQALRIKASSHDGQIQRVLAEKASNEKQIHKLNNRILSLERRLKDTMELATPSTLMENVMDTPLDAVKRRKLFNIPPLTPNSNEKYETAQKSSNCCICRKPAYGMMKLCQCGQDNCQQRVHATCVSGGRKGEISPN